MGALQQAAEGVTGQGLGLELSLEFTQSFAQYRGCGHGDTQRGVHLMGHARHQAAQRGQLLGLNQLPLGFAQLAHALGQLAGALGNGGLQLVGIGLELFLPLAYLPQVVAQGLQVLVGGAHQHTDLVLGMTGGLREAGILGCGDVHPGDGEDQLTQRAGHPEVEDQQQDQRDGQGVDQAADQSHHGTVKEFAAIGIGVHLHQQVAQPAGLANTELLGGQAQLVVARHAEQHVVEGTSTGQHHAAGAVGEQLAVRQHDPRAHHAALLEHALEQVVGGALVEAEHHGGSRVAHQAEQGLHVRIRQVAAALVVHRDLHQADHQTQHQRTNQSQPQQAGGETTLHRNLRLLGDRGRQGSHEGCSSDSSGYRSRIAKNSS